VGILAAMNISDELFSNKRTTEKMKNEVEGKISSLIEIVDEVIQQ
jgi:cell division protein ZapA (FtsZ GTPase activity inhibitor)